MATAGERALSVLDCTRLAPDAQEAAIRRLAAAHDRFEVRGWRAAERNLDFPAVWLAWPLHRQGAYLAAGGIEGAVARALGLPLSAWRITGRVNSLGGAAVTLRIEKSAEIEKKLDSHVGLT